MVKYIFAVLFIFFVLVTLSYLFMAVAKLQLQPGRWVCAQTAHQRVLIIDPVSGATQALMDTCVEWKPK